MTVFRRAIAIITGAIPWCLPICVGLTVMLASPPLAGQLRNLVFDQYQRAQPRPWTSDLPVRVVAIDDASLQQLGQWPWPRRLLADLADRLAAQGAAAITFDIVFAEEDRSAPANLLKLLPAMPERDALAQALEARGFGSEDDLARSVSRAPTILAMVLTQDDNREGVPVKTGFAIAGDDPRQFLLHFKSAVLPLPNLREAAAGLGAMNWNPNRGLVARQVPLLFTLVSPDGPYLVPSLDLEILRVAQHADTIIVKSSNASGTSGFGAATGVVAIKIGEVEIGTDADARVRVHFAGTKPGRRLSAAQVLAGTVPDDEIAGRIMLIGTTASALADVRSTPLEGAVPGIDIHAELLEHILSGAHLARPDFATGLEAFFLVLGGIAMTMLARFAKPIAAALAAFALLTLLGAASYFSFSQHELLFDPLLPGATWILAYVVMTIAVYGRSERQRKFVRNAFSRYLAPALVARLAADPRALELGGEARTVTVLFTDMRDFTRRSEKLPAAAVVDLLNRLHTPLTHAVLAQSGTIDKYLGDGMMAFWNAPLDVPNHADQACRAALAMRAALPALNAELAAEAASAGLSHEPVEIGIGINSGEVFVGNLGSQQRFDYSIIGDPVNVAARLEASTKELNVAILVSAATAQAASAFVFLPLGDIAMKGKTDMTPVFALHGEGPADSDFRAFEAAHCAALAAAREDAAIAPALLAKVRAHPHAAPYRAFYEMVSRRIANAALRIDAAPA
jgi:adenylate cyclase